jgi:membrane protease YdiL (CAAX protease family)
MSEIDRRRKIVVAAMWSTLPQELVKPRPPREQKPGNAALIRTALAAVAISLIPQGVWSALIVTNLRVAPAVPWAVLTMAVLLAAGAQYLRGAWGPPRSAGARRRSLRAFVVPPVVFGWAWLAGGLSMIALAGAWTVLASLTRMPGSVLPDLSKYPKWTAALSVAMGALISPLCEQAGIWGYWQESAERRWPPVTALVLTALFFAVGPHPPAGAPFVPKVLFFFLTLLTFSAMAYLTGSILPALPVHTIGLFAFFVGVWPYDPVRPLVFTAGPDAWVWIHIAQLIVFTVLACWAFRKLATLRR